MKNALSLNTLRSHKSIIPLPMNSPPGRNVDANLAAIHSDSQTPSQHSKRKRGSGENEDLLMKKAVKGEKSGKSKPGDDDYLDLEQGLNTAIGNLDSHLIADYVAQQDKRFELDLSAVEMEDRHIPGTPPYSFHALVSGLQLYSQKRYRESVCKHQRLGQAKAPSRYAKFSRPIRF